MVCPWAGPKTSVRRTSMSSVPRSISLCSGDSRLGISYSILRSIIDWKPYTFIRGNRDLVSKSLKRQSTGGKTVHVPDGIGVPHAVRRFTFADLVETECGMGDWETAQSVLE